MFSRFFLTSTINSFTTTPLSPNPWHAFSRKVNIFNEILWPNRLLSLLKMRLHQPFPLRSCRFTKSTNDFLVDINLCFNSISFQTLALVNSRVSTYFMDTTFARNHKVPLFRLLKPIPMEAIHGRSLSFGAILEETTPLVLWIGKHKEKFAKSNSGLVHPFHYLQSTNPLNFAHYRKSHAFHSGVDRLQFSHSLLRANANLSPHGDRFLFDHSLLHCHKNWSHLAGLKLLHTCGDWVRLNPPCSCLRQYSF